ncbi:MAG: tRNA-intron lyase [Candidatus Nezhaarchaeota archaeon]|nr:tRNA-intron lyase [Candidatus Nezhaarchaeota archaeon]
MTSEEGKLLRVVLSQAGLFVEDSDEAQRLHSTSYFGDYVAGKLKLTEVEALYLLERGRIKVFDGERELSFEELVKEVAAKRPKVWLEYLIYSDLRRRGYIVKEGFSGRVEFRVYRRGAKVGEEGAKFLVYGVAEGEPLDLDELHEMVRSARSLRKEPVLAIVNSQGEVCYYAVSLVAL